MPQFVGYSGATAGLVIFGALHDTTSNRTASLSTLVVATVLVILFAYLAGRNKVRT
jgi:MFS transporter, CP family, cyanate transporter